MIARLTSRLPSWFKSSARAVPADPPPAKPGRFAGLMRPGRVYILPTKAVITLTLVLFAMWYAAVSQNNQMAYALLFFLASLTVISMHYTHFNLDRLKLRAGRVLPVFAGASAEAALELTNPSRRERRSIEVALEGGPFWFLPAVPGPGGVGHARVRCLMPKRGLHPLPRVAVRSIYPLGLFEGRQYHALPDAEVLVYPAVRGSLPLPRGDATIRQELNAAGDGGDDYAGSRAYRVGESQRHVDWRAVARGQPLLVKQFSGTGGERIWLEWNRLPGALDVEAKLSQLTRWVLEAERSGLQYGLRFPGTNIKPSRGHEHQHNLLRLLALFEP